MKAPSIAIIGAGPIGIEAALEAKRRGFDVAVYEAGRVGEHLLQFGHVPLFTPFRMNSTKTGREALRAAGVAVPDDEELLTARALVERYLAPLASLAELSGSIREGTRVTHVGREGIPKPRGVVAAGDHSRNGAPFLLRVESMDGSARFDRADIVLDASGVYANANATGPSGLPAAGENLLGDRIERHIPAMHGEAGDRYRGKSVLLIGDGHSAATVLAEIGALLVSRMWTSRIEWVHRERGGEAFTEIEADPLPARRALAETANAVARTANGITRHPGATVEAYENTREGRVRVQLRYPSGEERRIEVDRVLALIGYRPDTSIFRELQVHLCYASEGPMDLAGAILADSRKSPGNPGDCLSQVAHGPESLRTPEPGFFILGAKSYGRNPSFLLTIGQQQILDVLSLLEAQTPAGSAAAPALR
jgi:thioredoxin reductase